MQKSLHLIQKDAEKKVVINRTAFCENVVFKISAISKKLEYLYSIMK